MDEKIDIIASPVLRDLPEVVHGFTTRVGGVSPAPFDSLNLSGSVEENRENARQNRAIVAQRLGIPPDSLVTVHQVLGSDVVEVDDPRRGDPRPKADAMITRRRGLFLMTLSADCALIVIADPGRGVVANAHASWRGTVGEIVRKTARLMIERYDADPKSMRAAVSPCIGQCCFEVRSDVAAQFDRLIPYSRDHRREVDGKTWFDLESINRAQLLMEGVRPEHIGLSGLCTKCLSERFYSYRRDGARTGRFGAIIGMRG